jgi:RNA polymerase sigma factor (sigma-70 family)
MDSSFDREDDLLHAFRTGDEKALNLVFNDQYKDLCTYTTLIVDNADIAEEIAVDVFHKLWNKRIGFDSIRSLKSYLYVSARNAAYNHLDKEQRKAKKAFAFFNGAERLTDPVINKIIYAEVLAEIEREVNALPEQCSKIIKMLYEQDMTPDEIAKELNISRGTVYTQKLRGIGLLKKRLSAMHFIVLLTMIDMMN